jgi:hypothetical protein
MTPSIPRVLAIIFVVACAFALGSCDPAYGPVIANGYRAPVTLHAMFSDQKPFDGVLPSGTDFWQRIEGRRLVSLTVTLPVGAQRTYGASALDRLRRATPFKEELWVVSDSGIRLEDLHRIAAIRKTLPPPKT